MDERVMELASHPIDDLVGMYVKEVIIFVQSHGQVDDPMLATRYAQAILAKLSFELLKGDWNCLERCSEMLEGSEERIDEAYKFCRIIAFVAPGFAENNACLAMWFDILQLYKTVGNMHTARFIA